jgi:hypothetical protein
VRLAGVPTLADFVDFVRRRTVGGEQADERTLIERWRRGAQRFRALESAEAGLVERTGVEELPASARAVVDRVIAEPGFGHAFGALPVAFGWVELDALAIYQHHVALDHVRQLSAALGARPTFRQVLELCLPVEPRLPATTLTRVGSGRFVLQSDSDDVRYLGAHLVPTGRLEGVPAHGAVAHAIGVLLGIGSGYVNVVRHGQRMILNNGYHRAYALRARGVTRVPCLIQGIGHPDELAFAGGSELVGDYGLLFDAPRPPLFKDLFDPELAQVFAAPATRRQIQVTIDVQSLRVPA